MYEYRITKYDPKNRNELGHYMVDEWTEFEDISHSFDGEAFNYIEYINIENKYIYAIELLMRRHGLGSMRMRGLEKRGLTYDETLTKGMIDMYDWLDHDRSISIQIMSIFCRLILRKYVWAKLVSPKMFVHFGGNYYMYIGASEDCSKEFREIEASGLFVEECESPYGR